VFPLAFPLLAGPGALTSIVLLMGRAAPPFNAAGVITALVLLMILTLTLLIAAIQVVRLLGVTGDDRRILDKIDIFLSKGDSNPCCRRERADLIVR
jgi:small neutral amino acid transporter SnatA (MarC family)